MSNTHWMIPIVVVVAAVAQARAQDSWRIPRLGAVEYRRTWTAAAGPAVRTAGEARAAAPQGKVPERYLPRLPPAPWLCQGELRPDQKAIADPVRDLRDVARALAFDLGSRSGVRGRFPRVLPFGDLTVSGSWSSPGPDGTQSLRATVAGRRPAAASGEPTGTAERLAAFCVHDVDGTLAMQRRIDPAAGLVASFQAEFDLVVAEEPKSFRRFTGRDRWDLVAVRDDQDADFRQRVAEAIRLGTGFVREAIDEQKSFLAGAVEDERSYGSGRLALGLLTLLHGGLPAGDPVVAKGFAELRRRKLVDSYSLATALMALAALHAPAGQLRAVDAAAVAQLDEGDRKVVAKWLERLLQNVDPRTDAAKVLRFNYVAGPRYDTSLQQYGLLGLWAARRCGAEVPGAVFAAAARQLLAVQAVAGGRTGLLLATYEDLREVAGTGAEPQVPELRVQRRGFAYEEPTGPQYGSMTSAGISGLLLARAGMQAGGLRDAPLEGQIDDAVRDGYGWLAAEFTVRANPGFAERADRHWYYWLWCLERSCELNGVARLHGRDWYYEGALQLLAQQQPNGSFRADQASTLLLDATCFAVLFLAKATARAPITGR